MSKFVSRPKISLTGGAVSQCDLTIDDGDYYYWQRGNNPPSEVQVGSLSGIDITAAYNSAYSNLNTWVYAFEVATTGARVYIKKQYAGSFGELGYSLDGGQTINDIPYTGGFSWFSENNCAAAYIVFGDLEGEGYYSFARLVNCNSGYWYTTFSGNDPATTAALNLIIDGAFPPLYTWTAWDQLNGNNGQYRCNLTKINDGVIDDISTHYQRDSSYFSRVSQQSSIMNIIQNSALDVERPIAYSGNAKLTLEVKAGTQSVSRKLVYRFYEPDGTTPLYSLEQVIYLAGTTPTNDVLLMFVHDDDAQAAAFLPVEKVIYQGGLDQFIFGDVSPTETEMLYIWLWLQMSGAGEPEYPYDTGSTDNGGDPTGNIGGDHIPTPALPTLGGMSSGFFTVYCPTESQLAAIAQYLWSDNVITNIRKYFTNFSDNIIALYVLPYKSASLPFKNFKVGNMEAQDITNVEYITARFVDIDMGSVYIENEYDSYLDYSPYTKFDCFLPAIGVVSLDADDIMCVTDPDTGVLSSVKGSTVSLKYTLDLMTGVTVAFITINGEMRYQFSGKVGYNIPLTGENYSGMATGFVTAVAGLAGTIATGGMTAPMSASAAVAGTINAMKPEIHRGGNLTGDASLLGGRTPYLIYRRPNKPLLEKQGVFTGFPSYKSGKLTDFTGYTEVIDAHVEGISCTETERAEILTLLKSGVII